MFALRDSRVARLLWDGADLAVEFATLGEYRLPEPASHPPAAAVGARRQRGACRRPAGIRRVAGGALASGARDA